MNESTISNDERIIAGLNTLADKLDHLTDQQPSTLAWRIVDTVIALLLTVALALGAWQARTTISHGQQLAGIEANRFTAGDGLDVWKEISSIRTEIATLPREVPPNWFLQRVDRIETRLDAIDGRLIVIESRINDP